MRNIKAILMCSIGMAFVLAAPCRAELLEDGKWWGTPWQKVKQENYTLTINSVGEVLVRGRNRITIGSPQMLFFWKNKSFSFHHDIHGKGPWKKVEGKREKMPDGTKITIIGEVADIRIRQTVHATSNSVTVKWDAEVIDPGPEMHWVRFIGHFFYCTGFSYKIKTTRGQTFQGKLGDPFVEMKEIESVEITDNKYLTRIKFPRAVRKKIMHHENPRQQHLPAKYSFLPEGIRPRADLMPGDRFGYTMKVTIPSVSRAD